jgi:hypothetical protein
MLCDRAPRWKKGSVLGWPGRPDIAFFDESSTPVTDDIILRASAMMLKNRRHYLESKRHHPE